MDNLLLSYCSYSFNKSYFLFLFSVIQILDIQKILYNNKQYLRPTVSKTNLYLSQWDKKLI